MGCGGSINQVYDNSAHLNQSTRPLKLLQFFNQDQSTFKPQQNQLYLFGQTRTQRNIIKITILQTNKQQIALLQKINSKHRIPKPKIKYDPIQLLYEEAQEVIPLNMYNSTSLPPFNLMFATFLSSQIIFLCGGTDYQFWNPVKQAFIYRLFEKNNQNKTNKTIGTDLSQKTVKRQFNKFERLSFMKLARYSHVGIFIKSKQLSYIYVFGGYNQQKQALRQCQRYSIQKDEWEQISPMNIPRATGFCFQFMGKIYLFGGFSGEGKRSKKIQVYNIQKNAWEILNVKLHQGIQQGFIYSFNPNQIIVIGGNTQGGQIGSTLQVNIIQQTYEWKVDMPQKGSLQKGLTYNDNIYLFGGSQDSIAQVYSYTKNQWTTIQIKSKEQLKKQDTYMFSYSTKALRIGYHQKETNQKQYPLNYQNKYCIFGNDQYPLILQINFDKKQLIKKSVPMALRLRQKMAILKIDSNRYFICGGIDAFNNKATKATFIFQTQTNKVKQMPKMSNKKFQMTLCRKNQFVYCFGGKIKERQCKVIGQCQKYNLWSNKWQKISSLIHPRSNCQTIVLESSIIVYGGLFQQQLVTSIEIYNICQNKFYLLKNKLKIMNPILNFCIQQSAKKCNICILNKINQIWSLQNYIIKTDQIQQANLKENHYFTSIQNQNAKSIEVQQKEQQSIKQIKHHQQINQTNFEYQKLKFEYQKPNFESQSNFQQQKLNCNEQKPNLQQQPQILIPVNTIKIKAQNTIEEDDIQFDNPNFDKNKMSNKVIQSNQINMQKNEAKIQNQNLTIKTQDKKQINEKQIKKNKFQENYRSIQPKQINQIILQKNASNLIQPYQTTQIMELRNTDQQMFLTFDQSEQNQKSIYLLSKKHFISLDLLKLQTNVKPTDFRIWNSEYSQRWPQLCNLNCKQVNFNTKISQNK